MGGTTKGIHANGVWLSREVTKTVGRPFVDARFLPDGQHVDAFFDESGKLRCDDGYLGICPQLPLRFAALLPKVIALSMAIADMSAEHATL